MMRRSNRWILLFAGWSIFGAVQSLMSTVLEKSSEEKILSLFAFYIPLAWLWAILTPVAGSWAKIVRRRTSSLIVQVLAHLPLLIVASLAISALRRVLLVTLGNQVQVPFDVTLLYFADLNIASYIAALWVSHVFDAQDALAERTERAHALESRLLSAQMEYLQLQLRPHFLFNALSSVAELGHEAPAVAARVLRNVIALLESALERHGPRLVSLGDELSTLSHYIGIERLRFSDWLTIDEEIDDAARDALVPPFVLQPLVENAIRHGLVDRSEPGRITIRASVAVNRLTIAIIDNGAGLSRTSSRSSRGVGMRNVRERLDALYGNEASLTLRELDQQGTIAELELPMTFAQPDEELSSEQPASSSDETPQSSTGERSSLRWMSDHPVVTAIAAWTVIGALRIQHSYIYLIYRDRFTSARFRDAVQYDAVGAMLWLLLTPGIFALARIIPFRRRRLWLRILAHAFIASSLALLHLEVTMILLNSFDVPLISQPSTSIYAWGVAVYTFLLIVAHLREMQKWIRDRDIEAFQLRKDLEEAKFQKSILELRPSALIDALEYLEKTIATDPARAEKSLADIGDFLRRTLDAMYHRDVSVETECANVRSYAEVLAIATHPGLTVDITVASHLARRMIPNGVIRSMLDTSLERIEAGDHARVEIANATDAAALRITVSAGGNVLAVQVVESAGVAGNNDYGNAYGPQTLSDDLLLRVG